MTTHLPTDLPLYVLVPAALLLLILLRRLPVIGRFVSLALWLGLAVVTVITLERLAPYDPTLARIASAIRPERQTVAGDETRLRLARDGHFWATVSLNGIERRMLIDSGATVTALSPATAAAAGLELHESPVPILLRTANGTVRAQASEVAELRLGNIVARDVPVVVAPGFGNVDVIGMNLLSRLKGWRVEGETLILTPNHPQHPQATATG